MKNQYFKKDKKAQVYFQSDGYKDDYGVYHKGGVYPIAASSLWCYARQNSQSLSFGNGVAYVNEESRFFVFNNNEKIKQGRLIKYKDAWYTIQRVDTADDYNGDMFVYADDTPTGEIPKQSDIKPYDPTKL